MPGKIQKSLEIQSDGMCLIYGEGDICLELGKALAPHLTIAILFKQPPDIINTVSDDIYIAKGKITHVKGSLGNFQYEIKDYAPLNISTKDKLLFEPVETHKTTSSSLFIDLSDGPTLLPGGDRRDGYYPLNPYDQTTLFKTALEIANMVGTFEKPIYIHTQLEKCAHSRAAIIGCTKCLDNCPLSAITSKDNTIHYSPSVCAGCGHCAALCPTEALTYAAPSHQAFATEVSEALKTYQERGNKNPSLLFYSKSEGKDLIHMLDKQGNSLAANIIPIEMHQVTSLDHGILLMALAAGAVHITILASPKLRDELEGLINEVALASKFMSALFDNRLSPVAFVETADPDVLRATLDEVKSEGPFCQTFVTPHGSKREITNLAVHSLRKVNQSQDPLPPLPLEKHAPYGAISVDEEKCTLCLACVSACPTSSLIDHADKPELSQIENQCIQCGLCAKTCPENAIQLIPRYNFSKKALSPQLLHQEQPFKCIACNKPFGVKSTIEKITDKLAQNHWMFESNDQIKLIKMCEDCRIKAIAESEQSNGRPPPRTTTDYLKEK